MENYCSNDSKLVALPDKLQQPLHNTFYPYVIYPFMQKLPFTVYALNAIGDSLLLRKIHQSQQFPYKTLYENNVWHINAELYLAG